MAKIITQETYDEIIKENIVEFSMPIEEAREETIKQLEAQGINLGNIIKDLQINEQTGEPILKETIDELKKHTEGTQCLEEKYLIEKLRLFTNECNASVPHRVLAGKLQGQDYICKIMEKELTSGESYNANSVLHYSLIAINAMTHKHPDIFNHTSLSIILNILKTQKNHEIICETLRWKQKATVLHETNRQLIADENLINAYLKPLLFSNEADVVKEVCSVFRNLILDDDVRLEFGKAHEHARMIASATLTDLTGLLSKFISDPNLLSEIMLTIASITVRNEFCQAVEEAKGLQYIMDAMVQYPESVKVNREAFKLFKALAGNDTVKIQIIQSGAAIIIASALNKFKSNEGFVKAGLACISTLALRNKENSTALYEAGVPEIIIDVMKIHSNSQLVQRNAAWAIRNMVSRCREQCETFISHDAESVLNLAMKNHPTIAQDIKSALRDLGCKVHLTEEWTGKGGIQIANELQN